MSPAALRDLANQDDQATSLNAVHLRQPASSATADAVHQQSEIQIPHISDSTMKKPFAIGTELRLGAIQFHRDIKSSIPLLLGDCITGMMVVIATTLVGRFVGESAFTNPWFGAATIAFILMVQHIHGLYPACGLNTSIEFRRVLRSCLIVISAVGLGFLANVTAERGFAFFSFISFGLLLSVLLPAVRSGIRQLCSRWRWWTQPVIVIGNGAEAESLFHQLKRQKLEGIRPLGIVYESNEYWEESKSSESLYIGPITDLESILASTGTCRVALASQSTLGSIDFRCYCGIPHVTMPTKFQNHTAEKTRVLERNGTLELHCFQSINSPNALLAKRCLDIGLILLSLPLLLPLLVVVALLVKITSPGPIFYSSKRIGQFGKEFSLWKFRSMVTNADEVLKDYLAENEEAAREFAADHKLKNDPRITGIGRFIRKTSIDELPQLWNVLTGEISLVGPRPILKGEVAKYGDAYHVYTLVRPGITGLWQISGRNNTSYEERLRYVRLYVQDWSCMLDVYILWRTIKTAVLQEGAY